MKFKCYTNCVTVVIYLFLKWVLHRNFYELQERETLATNRAVENNKKKKEKEGSLETNPEADSVFTNSMDSPEYLQIIACKTLRKTLRKHKKCRKRLKTPKLKVNCNSMS